MLPLLDCKNFEQNHPNLGKLNFRPLNINEDKKLLHSWLTQPYAVFWGLQGASVEKVEKTYLQLMQTSNVYLGCQEEIPVLLLEVYDPFIELKDHYRAQLGDVGMHFLVAPPQYEIISGYTESMMKLAMGFLFSSSEVDRVVVEPDIENKKIHRLNQRVGFDIKRCIELPDKFAFLSFCDKKIFSNLY